MPQNRKKEIEARRANIASLYLKGKTGREIAQDVGVTPSQVSQDLKIIVKRWQESAIEDISKKKAQDLAELLQVKKELWEAWEKSKESTKKRKKRYQGEKLVSEETEAIERLGDPRYISEMLQTQKQIAELLGYHADTKLTLDYDRLTNDQLDVLIETVMRKRGLS